MSETDEIVKVLNECQQIIYALALGSGLSYDKIYMIDLVGRIRVSIEVAKQMSTAESSIPRS